MAHTACIGPLPQVCPSSHACNADLSPGMLQHTIDQATPEVWKPHSHLKEANSDVFGLRKQLWP